MKDLFLRTVILFILSTFAITVTYADSKKTIASTISLQNIHVLPSQGNSTGSMALLSLHNRDSKPHYITRAYCSAAKSTMLHGFKNGRMKRVIKITLPAKKKTRFKKTGKHIMLIGLKKKLKVGMKVNLTLTFEDGSKKRVSAAVR